MSPPLDQSLAVLRPHLGAARFLLLDKKVSFLEPGRHALTVFDWSALSSEERDYFTEQQAIPLLEEHGRGWHEKLVPFAMLGGENHPMEDFDEQCNGILLLDASAASGGSCPVVFFPSPDGHRVYPFAASVTALALIES
jgi:hypothetical protein